MSNHQRSSGFDFSHIPSKLLWSRTECTFFLTKAFQPIAPHRFCCGVTLIAFALLSNVDLQYSCSKSHTDQAVIKHPFRLQPHSTALHRFLEQGPICPKPAASKGKQPVLTRISHRTAHPWPGSCQVMLTYRPVHYNNKPPPKKKPKKPKSRYCNYWVVQHCVVALLYQKGAKAVIQRSSV